LENDGRIDTFKDQNGGPVGPKRVWIKNEDIPGLAMTRAFGDAVSMLAGVNAEAEILEYEMTRNDKVIIIASDGVWEFMENEHVSSHLIL
jgi:serine/threonine protein phosphatase PrpC